MKREEWLELAMWVLVGVALMLLIPAAAFSAPPGDSYDADWYYLSTQPESGRVAYADLANVKARGHFRLVHLKAITKDDNQKLLDAVKLLPDDQARDLKVNELVDMFEGDKIDILIDCETRQYAQDGDTEIRPITEGSAGDTLAEAVCAKHHADTI